MAAVLLPGSAESMTVGSASPQAGYVGNTTLNLLNTIFIAESNKQIIWHRAGTFARWRMYTTSNTCSLDVTFTFRKNGADGNQSVVVPASTTGTFTDVSHTDTIADGDLLSMTASYVSTGTGTLEVGRSVEFTATSGTAWRAASTGGPGESSVKTYYMAFGSVESIGNFNQASLEVDAQVKVSASATLSNLLVRISLNSGGIGSTFGTRVNGANGNLQISIGAAATGNFEDTTHTDSLATNDLVCYRYVTDNALETWVHAAIQIETMDGSYLMFGNGTGGGNNHDMQAPQTLYGSFGSPALSPTESVANIPVSIAFTASRFSTGVTLASDAGATLTLRKNGVDQVALTLPSGTTGHFEDLSSTVAYAVDDVLTVRLDVGGTILFTLGAWYIWAVASGPSTDLNLALSEEEVGSSRF